MEDVVVSVAAKVAEYLVALVGRHCGYMIFTDSYVRQLEEERKKMENAKLRMQHLIDEAQNNTKPIEADVEKWVTDVETIANKARDVPENGRAKKTCLCGWLPNPKARYRLGREARTTVQAIQKLIQEGRFERVFYESAPPGLVVGASSVHSSAGDGGDTITDSRASIFQGIMKALDDEKLKVIGVFGPGGVGKTTLLREVEKKLREAGRPFHMIVKVEVSQIPDLNNIRDQIADALSLDLKDKQSPQGKADVLSEKLKRNPDEKVLMVFDNLWVKLDLEAVGIPWGDVSSKCKLLLTSRFKDVLEQEMGADRTFLLQDLKNDEAFGLFEKTVGGRLKDNEELKSIADQVVKKLAGLPLLIISVASTLKSSDESAWRNALIEIDDSNKEKKETIVRLSYDHLKSEDAKYLFLLCGLIGGTIQVELLFVLAMGLGLFERFNKTIQTSRDRMNNMLNELRYACLLLDGGNDKDNVTIHDLYSEVVISAPFRGHNSLLMNNNCGSWPKEKLEKCWAIWLTDVGKDRLAEIRTCRFRDLKILMLSQPKNWRWMPEHQHDVGDYSGLLDFTYMQELRVLYLHSMHITTLPSSIEILRNFRSLYLDHCDVEDVAILGNLEALQFLSFAGSQIRRLPKEIGKLKNLKLLNLSDCYMLQIIEPDVLKALTNLEELHMKGSFDEWIGKNEKPSKLCNVELAELRSMTKLNSLEISIRDPIILLEVDDLPFENLTRFWINIGNVYGREFKGLRTMKIKLEGHDSILSKKWVHNTLLNTQYLLLDGLGKFENAHELCIRGFPQLKHLDINGSPSIKYIASSSNSVFTILESLFLNDLVNLEEICHGHIAAKCLSKLKAVTIKVKNCPSLKFLFDFGSLDSNTEQNTVLLPELVRIDVENCLSLESLFNCGSLDSNAEHKIILLPKLKDVSVRGAKKLRHVVMSHSQIVLGFPSLEIVNVENCSDLRYLFPKYTATTLMKLNGLRISECKQMKEVILEKEAGQSEAKVMSFPCLSILVLEGLDNFEAFIPSPTSVKRQLGETAEESDGSPQPLFNEMVTFPNITYLEIKGLRCKELWNNQIPTDSFQKLENLKLKNNDNLQHIATSHMWKKLQRCLEKLKVISCHSIKIIYEGDGMDTESGELRRLALRDLENLRCIWQSNSLSNIPFPNLIYVEVERCPHLEMLFPTFTAKFLGQIEMVIVYSCEDMELIAGHEKGEEATLTTITFSKLNFLVLNKLPKFKRFFLHEKYSMKFQSSKVFSSLRDLSIKNCGAEPNNIFTVD